MVWVQSPWQGWRAWIYCSLPQFLFMMDLFVSTATIHDGVPPPKFLPGATEITVREGDVAILPCAVKHLGTKQVIWRRPDRDQFLTIGEMTWIDRDNIAVEHSDKGKETSSWNLYIDKVTPEDAGIYECQVTSKHGYHKLVTLNVVGPPIKEPGGGVVNQQAETSTVREINPFHSPIKRCGVRSPTGCLISIEGKRYVDLGEKLHLICNASGGSRIPQDIDWFKDGDMIDDSNKYPHVLIEKYQSFHNKAFISELVILRARLEDSGEYVCRSSRKNIVSMRITVLRADSTNKRRGSGSVPDSIHRSSAATSSFYLRIQQILHVQLASLLLTYFSSFCLFPSFTWTLLS